MEEYVIAYKQLIYTQIENLDESTKEGKDKFNDFMIELEACNYIILVSEDLEKLKDDVTKIGGKILIYAGDVRKSQDVKEAVELGVKEFGGIDILFSNAGIAAYGYSHELEEEQWDAMIEINLKGGWLVSKYVIPHMINKKSGRNYLQFLNCRT